MADIQDRLDKAPHRQYDREQQAILDWLTSVDYSRAFIIIDALDECSGAGSVLSRFMEELVFSLLSENKVELT